MFVGPVDLDFIIPEIKFFFTESLPVRQTIYKGQIDVMPVVSCRSSRVKILKMNECMINYQGRCRAG